MRFKRTLAKSCGAHQKVLIIQNVVSECMSSCAVAGGGVRLLRSLPVEAAVAELLAGVGGVVLRVAPAGAVVQCPRSSA